MVNEPIWALYEQAEQFSVSVSIFRSRILRKLRVFLYRMKPYKVETCHSAIICTLIRKNSLSGSNPATFQNNLYNNRTYLHCKYSVNTVYTHRKNHRLRTNPPRSLPKNIYCISDRRDSTPLQPTQPLPALSAVYILQLPDCLTE